MTDSDKKYINHPTATECIRWANFFLKSAGGWFFARIIMLIFVILIAIKVVMALLDSLKRRSVIDIVFEVLTS